MIHSIEFVMIQPMSRSILPLASLNMVHLFVNAPFEFSIGKNLLCQIIGDEELGY